METAVTLDEVHFKVVTEKARALGKSREEYLQSLIDADSKSFDEILQPARAGFETMNEEEVQGLLDRAQKAARQTK